VAEPWAARLEAETGAQAAIDERDLWPGHRFPTTVVVASTAYLKANPQAVKGLLAGHAALTQWIAQHPDEAKAKLRQALAALQGKALPEAVIAKAFARVEFLTDPLESAVDTQAMRAYDLGYLGARRPDLSGLFDLTLLKEVAP
jgi:NitT/TauT family transport system substrate-binding protein